MPRPVVDLGPGRPCSGCGRKSFTGRRPAAGSSRSSLCRTDATFSAADRSRSGSKEIERADEQGGIDGGLRPALVDGVENRWFGTYGVVIVPGEGQNLRLDQDEFDLVLSLDGSRTLDAIADNLGEWTVEVVQDLWEEGYLIGGPELDSGRFVTTPQGLEVAGAHRLVTALYRLFGRWAFTALGRWVFVGVIVTGLILVARAVVAGEPFVASTASPILAVVVIRAMSFVTLYLHELGHAIVVVNAGRKVGRVGFGFYWGTLSFYVDGSDVMICDRKTRMLQAAAGVLTELFLCGLAMIASVTILDAGSGDLIRQFVALSLFAASLQLVPLLDLDGYWFMADALERPMLRQEASAAARDIRGSLGDPKRRPLAIYGIASVSFGLVLLALSLTAWWAIFGDLARDLWSGTWIDKTVGIYFVLPQLAIIGHIALLARNAITNRMTPAVPMSA